MQDMLETVIPRQSDGVVCIVLGKYKGQVQMTSLLYVLVQCIERSLSVVGKAGGEEQIEMPSSRSVTP